MGSRGVLTRTSMEAAAAAAVVVVLVVLVEGPTDDRTMETPTGSSAPSNPSLMLPEGGPCPEIAHLFSSLPAWIHPALSGLMPTQIGCLELGLTHTQAAAPGERLELLIQVGETLVKYKLIADINEDISSLFRRQYLANRVDCFSFVRTKDHILVLSNSSSCFNLDLT